jgi:hypothetical protein
MRLDHLCDATWTYDFLHEVEQSERGDGRFYGQGQGVLVGRLSGTAQWSNAPRFRDGYALPNASGVVHLPDGGEVLYDLRGMSSLADGRGIHILTFQTAQPSHLWLNNVIAIGEGTIDVENSRLAMRYYECTAEVPVPDFLA